MDKLLYFAYGSNMSTLRLRHRTPSACALGIARLPEHRLMFHKVSGDRSGKCDIEHTGLETDSVLGVVYELASVEKPVLDQFEDLGSGYDEKQVSVLAANGNSLAAFTYYALRTDPSLKPYDWYKFHLLYGAQEHGFPVEYLQQIENTESLPDPDRERHLTELAIYEKLRSV